ncbi:MAG: non-homologous end-joining DNA ligase, partial [Candidatus Acidiferrales bacterium]
MPTNPAGLTNAKKSPMAGFFRPALATLSQDPPTDDTSWFYEIKFDGIRVLSFVDGGKTRLFARSGRDISREYPELAALAKQVRARRAILDGEIVVLDRDGRSNFQRLQSRFGVQNPPGELQQQAPPTLYLFDLVYCDGYDLRRTPLVERKKLLTEIVRTSDQVRISEHQAGEGRKLYAVAMEKGLEGIIGKRAQSAYPDGRSTEWLKFKGVQEIDGVIGGWTSPRGTREFFGSLLVGLYEGADLQFVGGVGTGYSREVEKSVFDKLQKIATPRCPFSPEPRTKEEAHWVKPAMVARVGYAEWTSDRHLRQPRFLGLQPDRNPKESTFVKEKAPALPGAAPRPDSNSPK